MKTKLNFSLRIAIIDKCNFSCLYCPTVTSMENYCPEHIKEKNLSIYDFKKSLAKLLDSYEFTKIVITGGEPLLSKNIFEILKFLSSYDNKIELDTNGSLFSSETWNNIKSCIDGVKISLDSLNPKTFDLLTNNNNLKSMENINKLIDCSLADGIPVTINCVYTKKNKEDVLDVIKFAVSKNINVSVLDLYYTKETEQFWKDNFLNIEFLLKKLEPIYGFPISSDAYGCDFKHIYYNTENYIRVKSSFSSTMRDKNCETCDSYCQEGIFSLRFSCQGWITPCQINNTNGTLLLDDTDEVNEIIERINNAKVDPNSFGIMLKKLNLGTEDDYRNSK